MCNLKYKTKSLQHFLYLVFDVFGIFASTGYVHTKQLIIFCLFMWPQNLIFYYIYSICKSIFRKLNECVYYYIYYWYYLRT